MTRLVGFTTIWLLFLCHPDKSDSLKIVRMQQTKEVYTESSLEIEFEYDVFSGTGTDKLTHAVCSLK